MICDCHALNSKSAVKNYHALLQSLPDYIILCYYIHFITLLLFFVKRESFSSVKSKKGMSFFI